MQSESDEIDLVWAAASDPAAKESLRKYLRPFAEAQADRLIDLHGFDTAHRDRLVEAGLSALDRALTIYIKRGTYLKSFSDPEYFGKYFSWWARQAMVASATEGVS